MKKFLVTMMIVGLCVSPALAFKLTWTDASTNESGFNVYRGTVAGGTKTKIGSVGTNVTTYTDTPTVPGTYYYQVSAFNDGGESAMSNEASGVILPSIPSVPSNLQVQ